MVLSLILSRFARAGRPLRNRFVWSPALDLRDRVVYSTLLPGAQY